MGIKEILLLSLIFLFLCGCAPRHPVMVEDIQPEPGVFFSGRGHVLKPQVLADQIRDKDYILIGESHDNPCDHKVQAEIIGLLGKAGVNAVIALEMVTVPKQNVLDEFNQGLISLEELPVKLEWDQRWGHDFELYRPIFKQALEHKISVKALNAPQEVVRKISHYGLEGLDNEDWRYLPHEIIPPKQEQLDYLKMQFEVHEQFIPEDRADFEHFIQAQSAWDTQMAAMALYWRKKTSKTVVVLAGLDHVRLGWGIEHRLNIISPGKDITRIVPVRDPGDISNNDPFYFFCPAVAQERVRFGLLFTTDNDKIFLRGVMPGSSADHAGLRSGDRIVRAGGKEVTEVGDLHRAAKKAVQEETVLKLEVIRDNEIKLFELALPGED